MSNKQGEIIKQVATTVLERGVFEARSCPHHVRLCPCNHAQHKALAILAGDENDKTPLATLPSRPKSNTRRDRARNFGWAHVHGDHNWDTVILRRVGSSTPTKNLGTALVESQWIEDQVQLWRSKMTRHISEAEASQKVIAGAQNVGDHH